MTEYLFRSERQRDDSPSLILVVDDEEVICRMLGALLEKKGYRVRTATDFTTALGYLDTEQFDLVITDLYFPGGDGIDIIRRVKTDDPDIPVIALTGSPEQQAIIDVFRNQADDILIKPVGKDELYFRVSGTLEKRFLRLREKEMKLELETREQLFRAFMDHLPLHIFINDEEDRLIYANTKHDEYYDSRNHLLQKLESFFPPDMAVKLYEQNREARETGLKDYFQTTVTRDGSARTFRMLLFPLNLGDKKNLLAGIGIDMTDQILAREALKASEERLAAFIRTIPHGLMENDTEGIITLCNEGYCKLLGLEPEEVLGRNVIDFQPTEEEKRKRRKLIESLNVGNSVPGSFTGRILHSSGEIKDVQVDWNYHREEDGRITGYVAAVTDITPLLKAEGRIHSSEALLKSIMESPRNVNVWSVDKDIRYTFFNYNHKNAMKLYWGADIEIGVPLLDYIPNKEYVLAAKKYYHRVLGGEHITLVDKIPNPEDGAVHMFENYANPISDDDGRITGATIFTIDITERLKNEERIKQSLKEKEVLLKEIHHRVKNNLQIISSILNMQTEGIEDDSVRKIFLDSQNRILSMSLIHEQLYQNEDVSGIQMEPYIQSLLATIVSSLTSPTETVTISSTVEPMELDIDTAIPVGLILNELVSNALKYACGKESEGELVLNMETLEGNRCRIVLKDSGPGISDTPDSVKKNSLGLQLVHALTEQLGGTFSMKNDNGLVCTLEFPTPSQS